MQIDSVLLTGNDLAKIAGTFGSLKPPYSKSVTVNFTDGKLNDARWGKESKKTLGLTKPSTVNVDDQNRKCTADILIDLAELLLNSVTPASTIGRQRLPAKLSAKALRYNAIIAVVHELVHVYQGWQFGSGFAKALLDEKISATARAADYADANPGMPADPYLQNQFEQGARDFTARWSDVHAGEVHAGTFDFLLPMSTMRGLFPDDGKAFSR